MKCVCATKDVCNFRGHGRRAQFLTAIVRKVENLSFFLSDVGYVRYPGVPVSEQAYLSGSDLRSLELLFVVSSELPILPAITCNDCSSSGFSLEANGLPSFNLSPAVDEKEKENMNRVINFVHFKFICQCQAKDILTIRYLFQISI